MKDKGLLSIRLISLKLPDLAVIINRSTAESMMMLCLKPAIITPLLKRSVLDKEDMKNWRSISNLPYIY